MTSSCPRARVRPRSRTTATRWTAGPCPGAPAGSPGNDNDWIVGTSADIPPSEGASPPGSFARQPEIIGFLAAHFGPYPFSTGGGIVDDVQGLGFALETQTRPVYARDFFTDSLNGDNVVVHEIAHQWYGDSVALARWQHIWLNEGFASYAEWLWSEDQGLGTAQEIFDFWNEVIPPDDPFWSVSSAIPGPDLLFDFSVYIRGAMTLHTLRQTVGDTDFFEIMQTWAADHAGGNVTTDEFIALAESISGQDLGSLFDTWLFTAGQPGAAAAAAAARCGGRRPPCAVGGPQPDRAVRQGFVPGHAALTLVPAENDARGPSGVAGVDSYGRCRR